MQGTDYWRRVGESERRVNFTGNEGTELEL